MHAAGFAIGSFPFIASLAVLVLVYLFVITEWINRAAVALLGAALLVVMGVLSQEQAIKAVDFNTVGFLAGMMIVLAVARKSGLFEYIAVRTAQIVKGSPAGILAALALVTAVLSAGLDNVTTVLLIAPVTLSICAHLKVPPYPFLFTQILASNIGGTATLIGDPPNILIGSATHLSFNDFVVHLAPLAAVVLVLQTVLNQLIWGKKLKASKEQRALLMGLDARKEIKNARMFRCSLLAIGAILAAFAAAEFVHLEAATIALLGAAVMLILDSLPYKAHRQHENILGVLKEVEWITIFFFIGLFVVVGAVEHAGVITWLAAHLTAATGGDLKLTATAVLWLSAVASAIIDNIPFVATMIPMIKDMAPGLGGHGAVDPVWWALALGACLGGNGSLVGASANLVVAGIAEKAGLRFSFLKFTLLAFPMMLGSVAVAQLYLWWRYF
jgi:Na+/H+ antiporter NhaD/arsenite permease-like protein